jgi:hypothetical protein
MNDRGAYVVVPYQLLYLNMKPLLGKLSHCSIIWLACGALMFFLEIKERGGEQCVPLLLFEYSKVLANKGFLRE